MARVIFKSTDPLIPVEIPKLNELYHVAWGLSHGVVGRCVDINENTKTVVLRTPKTRKLFKRVVKWADLRHTRANQVKIQNPKPKKNENINHSGGTNQVSQQTEQ